MTGNVLVIGGRPSALTKVRSFDTGVLWMQQRKAIGHGAAEAADCLVMLQLRDIQSSLEMARALHKAFGIDRVMSLVDQGQELAGAINDDLGLPGISAKVGRRFTNKLAMRDQLRQAGLEDVPASPVSSEDDLRGFGDRHGWPVVMKPISGTGSRGVQVVSDASCCGLAWRRWTSLTRQPDLPFLSAYPPGSPMVEKFLSGTEVSVEGFSFGGKHVFFGITQKTLDGVVELGHAFPAPLPVEQENAVIEHVRAFLDAMELRDGPSHTEVRITPEGPRIVEGHSRVGGGGIMDLIEAVTGVDVELYAAGWATDSLPPLTRDPIHRGAAATVFLHAPEGQLVEVRGLKEVQGEESVLKAEVTAEVGDQVPALRENFARLGQVTVFAENATEAVAKARRLAAKVTLSTVPAYS